MTITEIKRRYTKIKRIGEGVWGLWLRVDQQSFRIISHSATKSEVMFFREMLAIALKKIIKGCKA
jgi:hypothetical protein